MRRKSKKEGIYVCMWLIYFDIQQKLTQDCKAAILQFRCFVFCFFFLMHLDIKFSINTFSEKESPLIHCISKGL